ncbi:hypothetical protein Tco_0204861 [Tanacetum coccineum]
MVFTSIWRVIVQEMEAFKAQGIDLFSCMQKKLGNGADTSFWDDVWRGDTTLKQRFHRSGVEQTQMMDLMAYIEGVVLGVASDRWYWSLDGSGEL